MTRRVARGVAIKIEPMRGIGFAVQCALNRRFASRNLRACQHGIVAFKNGAVKFIVIVFVHAIQTHVHAKPAVIADAIFQNAKQARRTVKDTVAAVETNHVCFARPVTSNHEWIVKKGIKFNSVLCIAERAVAVGSCADFITLNDNGVQAVEFNAIVRVA